MLNEVNRIEAVNDNGLDVISGPDFAAIRINRIQPRRQLSNGDAYLLAVNISQHGCDGRWGCLDKLIQVYDANFDLKETEQDFSAHKGQTMGEALNFATDIIENLIP